ncbi:GNAT family N-acetyltransferase [Candidatus Babeliales bacterium]|nr:GNAT family N-acetyltransferase [Candidatus Babeliales bacterium]
MDFFKVLSEELDKSLDINIKIENNLKEKLLYFPSKIKSMQVTTIDNMSLIDSKLSSNTFNAICDGTITKELAQQVVDYYQKINSPMAWWIGPNSQKNDTDEVLKSAGLVHDETDVGMFCDLSKIPDSYPMPKTLKIKICKTPQDFIDFGEAASTCFDSPDNINVKKFYKQVGLLNKKDFSNSVSYIGYENDQPIATAFLLLTDVAGIYDITTHPEKRNKGYGSAMFYKVLAEAKERGYKVGVLEASPSGLNIYKRFGFEEICKFNVWSNKGIIKK